MREFLTTILSNGVQILAIDDRFRPTSSHLRLPHFKNGILSISQWTRREHKEMQKVFLGIRAGSAPTRVIAGARSLLDFICHMQEALDLFHANKHIFID
jgi:hypothetical protein